MYTMETIRARHSVRKYTDKPIEGEALAGLQALIDEARAATGLDIQLVRDNPEVFDIVASFGVISGCGASIVFPANGREDDDAIGYWGQHIVLGAQDLGLNTCWAMLCARKNSKARVPQGQKIRLVIAVGYGVNGGYVRKTKPLEELCAFEGEGEMPAWFAAAMEAAQLAPTGMNAQSFRLTLLADGKTVRAEAQKRALRVIDLGIVRRNFEVAANELGADWRWETAAEAPVSR